MRLSSATLLLLPMAIGTFLLLIIPALATLLLAFTDYNALQAPQFSGSANFERLWADPMFWAALKNSLWVAVVSVPLRLLLALLLALALHAPRRGAGTLRAGVFLPSVVPDIAWAILWLWILNPLYGPTAWLLGALGLRPDIWLVAPWAGRGAVVLITLFLLGEIFIVLLAARREIAPELYELSAVEGASRFTIFCRVTLPLLWPVILFLAARDVALTLQTTFVPALIVTKGGPNFSTLFLPLYVYQSGFEYLRFGYAAALTLGMFLITAAMMAVQVVLLRRWVLRGA